MNNNVVFENEYVESFTSAGETIFFTYEPSPLDIEPMYIEPMWDVGNDDYMDDLDNDSLSLYNEN